MLDFSRPLRYSLSMPKTHRKNPAAVALGRLGGQKGGPARAASMTAEERSDSARNAVRARWARYKSKHRSGKSKTA
jgi:hypothetical protein